MIESIIEKSKNDSLLNIELGIKQISLDLYLPQYESQEKVSLNILMNDKTEISQ